MSLAMTERRRNPGYSKNVVRLRGQRRPRRGRQNFASQLLIGMAVAGFIGWQAAPELKAGWTFATSSPEQIQQRESSAYYPNCGAARAAGVAPIHAGEPGYRDEMDGDLDGIACEPYRY